MAAQLSAETVKLPIIRQSAYTFVAVQLPKRSTGIFMSKGAHVWYQKGAERKETDDHVKVVYEPVQTQGVFFGEHIDSPEGTSLWTDYDIWGSFGDPIDHPLDTSTCTYDQQILCPLEISLYVNEGEGHRISAT